MTEVEVEAVATCLHRPTRRELAVLRDQPFESVGTTVIRVDVNHDELARGTGADGDVRARPMEPPRFDLAEVGRRCLQSSGDSRVLARRAAIRMAARASAWSSCRRVAGQY